MPKHLLLTLEYPPDIGGVATYYYNLVKADPSKSVLHLESTRRLGWLKFLPLVRQKVKKEKIDVIEIGQVLPLGYIGLFFKAINRRPYLMYTHGLDVLQKQLSKWKKFWIKVILKNANQIITNSNFVKNKVKEIYGINEDNITVIYPVIDAEAIKKEAAKLPDVVHPAGVKIILSVGRLVERKGFDKMIEALNQILNSNLNCEYWIIGDGPDKARLMSLVKKYNLEDEVKFLGAVPVPELYKYYEACDIFIMPSREIDGDVEGFGIVFLEAGVFGKPVIGGRSGGIPEAVIDGATGLLVDPLSIDEVRQALVKLLSNEELAAKLGQQGYERVKQWI